MKAMVVCAMAASFVAGAAFAAAYMLAAQASLPCDPYEVVR